MFVFNCIVVDWICFDDVDIIWFEDFVDDW